MFHSCGRKANAGCKTHAWYKNISIIRALFRASLSVNGMTTQSERKQGGLNVKRNTTRPQVRENESGISRSAGNVAPIKSRNIGYTHDYHGRRVDHSCRPYTQGTQFFRGYYSRVAWMFS